MPWRLDLWFPSPNSIAVTTGAQTVAAMRSANFRSLARLMLAIGLVMAAAAQAQPDENALKASFIPKFAGYVQWPAGRHPRQRQPFQICVVGSDPFGPLLDRAADRRIAGHNILVRRLPSGDLATGCHIAFVRGAVPADTARLLLALRGQPVLTITDSRAGPQRGMIHLTSTGGRVRFFIDEAEAADRGLMISSRLLALALGVRQRRT